MTTLRRQEERVLSSEPSDVIRAETRFSDVITAMYRFALFPFRLCFDLT